MKLSEAARKGMEGKGHCRKMFFDGRDNCCFLGAAGLATKPIIPITEVFPELAGEVPRELREDMEASIPGFIALPGDLFTLISEANDESTLDDPREAIADVLERHGM